MEEPLGKQTRQTGRLMGRFALFPLFLPGWHKIRSKLFFIQYQCQVSSEEEQEKPGNFIQGKPRMSLVRQKYVVVGERTWAQYIYFLEVITSRITLQNLANWQKYNTLEKSFQTINLNFNKSLVFRFAVTDTPGNQEPTIFYDTLMWAKYGIAVVVDSHIFMIHRCEQNMQLLLLVLLTN